MKHDVDNGTGAFNPILRTKLHRPQLSADLVNRDRLIKTMNRAQEVPLTLVSAPAGYGKSVLVAQWVEQLNSPIAWLSLDVSDSELRTFLEYFLAAVDTASPGACGATRELLEAASLCPVPVLANYLLNDLEAIDAPCAIVLDDYHRIDPLSPVQDLMLHMLEHPPRQFRFIVLTRYDPPFDLPSLRAGHRLNDVRQQDLRFAEPEIGEFLGATVDLSISDEALTKLEREVEGWAAGLRLVSLALRHVADPDDFLKRLQDRVPQIQEYLLREVLGTQGAGVRDFLLASSILDRFCVELLDAICAPADRDDHPGVIASDFLEELRRNNLFTISIDAGDKWFRYHHLFQELLKTELQRLHGPDHVSALHLRANQWFESEGLIDEAIKHALAAGDMERVADLVTRHRHAALDADQWYVLENWLSLIPEIVLQQRAELLVARAWILLNHLFQVEPVPALLDRVESLLGDAPDREPIRGELSLCRGYLLWLTGDGAESLKHMEVALQKIPVSHFEIRSSAEIIFSVSTQMIGNRQQAIRCLDDLLLHSDSMQEVRKSRLLYAYVFIHLTAGDLHAAELAAQRLRVIVERGESVYARVWTDYLFGVIHLSRCEWESAVEYLGRSVTRRFIHHRRAATDSMLSLMLAYHALGQEDEAQATMQRLQEYVAYLDDPAVRVMVASAETRLAILQERPGPTRRWLDADEPPAEGFLFWWIDIPLMTRCRAMIAVGSPDKLAHAVARLRECAEVNETHHNTYQLIKVLTLLAMAYENQGKTEQALGVLERALSMAGKGNLLFPFVELGTPMVDLLNKLSAETEFTVQVERLVTAFGGPANRSNAPEARADKSPMQGLEGRRVVAGRNLEDLTNRELDVLELLSLRLKDKEIAARLNISYQTVGSHLKQIYKKLGVHGRRKAVEQAAKTGILERHPSG